MSGCIANELTSTSARGSIHGHIHWDNGRHTDFIYARIVNGEERKADFIELDGERYERVRECEMIEDPPDALGEQGSELYPCYKAKCSSCGALLWEVNPMNYCPNCGAKVKEVGA